MKTLAEFFANYDVILLGPTGSGKSTFIERVQREAPVRYVSLGNITRSRIADGDLETTKMLELGGKWPLEFTLSLVEPYLRSPLPYVLDGLPKHVDEADWLVNHLSIRPRAAKAILLEADDNVLRARASNRAGRRETAAEIDDRLRTYGRNIGPIRGVLANILEGRVLRFDTSQRSVDQLMRDLESVVGKLGKTQ